MTDFQFGSVTANTATPGSTSFGYASEFSCTADADITEIRLYANASTTVAVAMYDDDSGSPGNRLTYAINQSISAGENFITVPSASVSDGETYWLFVVTNTVNSLYAETFASGNLKYKSATVSTPPPDPFGSSSSSTGIFTIAAYGTVSITHSYDAGSGQSVSASIENSDWSKTKAYSGTGKSSQISTPSGDWQQGVGHVYDAGSGQSVSASIENSDWSKTKAYSGTGKSSQISTPSGDWAITIVSQAGIGVSKQVSVGGPGSWTIGTLHHFDAGSGLPEIVQLPAGVWTSAALTPFRGTLKRAMLFNRALTSHEVKALYNRAIIESE